MSILDDVMKQISPEEGKPAEPPAGEAGQEGAPKNETPPADRPLNIGEVPPEPTPTPGPKNMHSYSPDFQKEFGPKKK